MCEMNAPRTAPLSQGPPALLASASSAGGTMAIDPAGKCSKWNILGKARHSQREKRDRRVRRQV